MKMPDTEDQIPPDTSLPETDIQEKPSRAVGDIAIIASGTLLSQVLVALLSPILARLFLPPEYGTYQVFNAIFSIIVVVASLRYEMAIVLPKANEEAINVLAVSSFFALLVSALTVPFFAFFGQWLVTILNAPALLPYLWLISLNVFLIGIFNAINYWNTRTRKFGRLSIARFINSAGSSTAQLGIGFSGIHSSFGLILGTVVGSFLATAYLAVRVWREDSTIWLKHVRLPSMIQALKRYKKFPLFSTWSVLLNTASIQLPSLLLSSLFGPEITGYYSLGYRILRLPAQLLGMSISQVVYQRAAKAANEGVLAPLVQKTLYQLIILGMFPFLLLSVIGKEAFTVVYGSVWTEAGVYTQILSIWTFFTFIGSPISTINSVLEKQEIGLYFNIALFLTRLGSLFAGYYLGSARSAIILYAITGVIAWMVYTFWITKAAGVRPGWIVSHVGKSLLMALPFLVVICIFKWVIPLADWAILLLGVILLILYFLVVSIREPEIRGMLVSLLKKGKKDNG
jgi:O-antigen/teichoic acid export membrane protein